MRINEDKDIFGCCCKSYYNGDKNTQIIVHTDIAETNVLSAKHLFTYFEQMPHHED